MGWESIDKKIYIYIFTFDTKLRCHNLVGDGVWKKCIRSEVKPTI